jgi:hypothetical protein
VFKGVIWIFLGGGCFVLETPSEEGWKAWISGANTPRKSDQVKTVAIILAQVAEKML